MKDKLTLEQLLDSTEAGDEITRHTLQWHYKYLMEDTKRLSDKENIKPYEAQDIDNNIMYMEAIKTTLKFFGGNVK